MKRVDQSYFTRPEGIPERPSAGGIIVRKEHDTLRIALVTEPHYPDYLLPKGGVEKGEDLQTAAKREIQEEAGLTKLKLITYLGKTEHLSLHKKNWGITYLFLFITDQIAGHPTDKNGHNYRTEWFPIDNLPRMFWPDQKKIIEDNKEKIKELVKAY
jgi:8-oxo-dGTP pyrophosphatase MutT (NUDIX family)